MRTGAIAVQVAQTPPEAGRVIIGFQFHFNSSQVEEASQQKRDTLHYQANPIPP